MGLSPVVQFLKQLGLGKLLNQMNSESIKKVVLSDIDRQYIKERIEEDVVQFGKLVDKDFSYWLKE